MTVTDDSVLVVADPAPDMTPLNLRSWGLSGQPATWALSTWTSVIEVIRAANLGFADLTMVQAGLDARFPDAGYQASDVALEHPPDGEFVAFASTEGDLSVRVDLDGDDHLGLPDENVAWDFGDGTVVYDAGGWDHTYAEPGVYAIRLTEMVAGVAFTSTQDVTVGTPPEDEPVVDVAVAERPATVFESDTDDLPNDSLPRGEEDVDELPSEPEAYDPGAHTVDEVLAYAEDHPDEVDQIIRAEEAGRNRVGILDHI